jgi:hypothetical protein
VVRLHEDGFKLADRQSDMVYVQEAVYLVGKAYWDQKEREQAEAEADTPSGY